MRKWHRENLERIRADRRCESCGSTEDLCFTDYHSPFKNRRKRIEAMHKGYMPILENATCLCRSCFMSYCMGGGKEPKPFAHGTYRMYRRGFCRCPECRAANAARVREERRRRKERNREQAEERSKNGTNNF